MFTSPACRYWRRRRMIAFALITALAWAILAGLHSPANHAHSRAGARPAATARHAARPRPASTRILEATAGRGLRWAGFHGIALPSSATDGPRHTRNGLAWGFADTPRGALLAAVNIAVRTAALWGPGIYRPTISRQVTGADQAALLAADNRDYARL